MRFFTENLEEVFFYEIGYGSEFSGGSDMYFSRREISPEEFAAAVEDHKKLREKYFAAHKENAIQSGLNRARELSGTKNRVKQEEREAIMKAYHEGCALIEKVPEYEDFIVKRFSLEMLDPHDSF